jgi:DNA mismatch repair protein MutL
VVVDQHAAHERIVYEKLKASLARNGVQRQILLIPEIVELDEATVEQAARPRRRTGLVGAGDRILRPGAVAVRETPSLLGKANAAGLLRDLAEHMAEWTRRCRMERRPDACRRHHGLPRLGARRPRLKPEEMNALLREMEDTPNSGSATTAGRPMSN